MNLYYILSCIIGIFIKIYDDFTDLKMDLPIILEISKIIIIICSFLLIQKSYILSIIVFISLIVSNYCKKFDDSFWYAYMGFIGVLCFVYWHKFYTIIDNFLYKLLFIIYIPICIYIEETTFSEEISKNKMLYRSYGIIINSIIMFVLEHYNYIETYDLYYFTYLLLFVNSYFITNIIIQLIFVYNSKQKIQKKIKNKKKKKSKAVVNSCNPVTLSPCHPVTLSPCNPVTL